MTDANCRGRVPALALQRNVSEERIAVRALTINQQRPGHVSDTREARQNFRGTCQDRHLPAAQGSTAARGMLGHGLADSAQGGVPARQEIEPVSLLKLAEAEARP